MWARDVNRYRRPGRRHVGAVVASVLLLSCLTVPSGSMRAARAANVDPAAPAAPSHRYDTTPEFDRMRTCSAQLITDAGKTLPIKVRIADEPKLQAAGFQRIGDGVIENSFILFVYDREEIRQFHMHNVRAPLDIAFIDSDGTIQEVLLMQPDAAMPAPFLNLYKPTKSFQYALEARAGFFKEQGLSAGRGRLQIGTLFQ
jgi:uncharacterized membrane protein (UPF0127 family)